jgi:hypothetical protein
MFDEGTCPFLLFKPSWAMMRPSDIAHAFELDHQEPDTRGLCAAGSGSPIRAIEGYPFLRPVTPRQANGSSLSRTEVTPRQTKVPATSATEPPSRAKLPATSHNYSMMTPSLRSHQLFLDDRHGALQQLGAREQLAVDEAGWGAGHVGAGPSSTSASGLQRGLRPRGVRWCKGPPQ